MEKNIPAPRLFITNQAKLAAILSIERRRFSDIKNGYIEPSDTFSILLEKITGIDRAEWKNGSSHFHPSKLRDFFKKEREDEMNSIKGKAYSNYSGWLRTKIEETNTRIKFIK